MHALTLRRALFQIALRAAGIAQRPQGLVARQQQIALDQMRQTEIRMLLRQSTIERFRYPARNRQQAVGQLAVASARRRSAGAARA
jgi:hypothetical protein